MDDVAKVGDEVWVKCIGQDDKGRSKLSRKAAIERARRPGRSPAGHRLVFRDNANRKAVPRKWNGFLFVEGYSVLRVTPAMQVGIVNHVWSLDGVIALLG